MAPLSQEEEQRRDGIALKMRLSYEMGLVDASDLKKQSRDWDDQMKDDMRRRYSRCVASVTRYPPQTPEKQMI